MFRRTYDTYAVNTKYICNVCVYPVCCSSCIRTQNAHTIWNRMCTSHVDTKKQARITGAMYRSYRKQKRTSGTPPVVERTAVGGSVDRPPEKLENLQANNEYLRVSCAPSDSGRQPSYTRARTPNIPSTRLFRHGAPPRPARYVHGASALPKGDRYPLADAAGRPRHYCNGTFQIVSLRGHPRGNS